MPEQAPGSLPADGTTDAALADLLDALRQQGAAGFDPVSFAYLEALVKRLPPQSGALRERLENRLHEALAAFRERFAQADEAARRRADRPNQAQPSPLAELVARLAAQTSADASPAAGGTYAELKAVTYFRETWSTLSVDRQLTQALEQGPENAGPLNSHQLVLRALQRMREVSPAYLKRFMSYADALLWLDQANGGNLPQKRQAARSEPEKKHPRSKAR